MTEAQRGSRFMDLVALMERLLAPAPDGCPWDREQTLASLRSYLVEETYEVLEALDADHPAEHCDELGDLLFQIVFQAALRQRQGQFDIDDVAQAIHSKMVRRHPHVFSDTKVKDAEEVLANWSVLKAKEHREKGTRRRILDGVPLALPALVRAQRIGEKAAAVGFDWPDIRGVRDKIAEELNEIDQAVAAGNSVEVEAEVGDLLLAVSRYAAKLGVSPEDALRGAVRRFQTRFEGVEERVVSAGGEVKSTSLEELDRHWNAIKQEERVPKK